MCYHDNMLMPPTICYSYPRFKYVAHNPIHVTHDLHINMSWIHHHKSWVHIVECNILSCVKWSPRNIRFGPHDIKLVVKICVNVSHDMWTIIARRVYIILCRGYISWDVLLHLGEHGVHELWDLNSTTYWLYTRSTERFPRYVPTRYEGLVSTIWKCAPSHMVMYPTIWKKSLHVVYT